MAYASCRTPAPPPPPAASWTNSNICTARTDSKVASISPQMKRRVAIIGTGWVGASVAISTLHHGVADELLLDDRRSDVAEGEAMDLGHGAAFYASATVRTA